MTALLLLLGPPKALDEDETEFLDKLETVSMECLAYDDDTLVIICLSNAHFPGLAFWNLVPLLSFLFQFLTTTRFGQNAKSNRAFMDQTFLPAERPSFFTQSVFNVHFPLTIFHIYFAVKKRTRASNGRWRCTTAQEFSSNFFFFFICDFYLVSSCSPGCC